MLVKKQVPTVTGRGGQREKRGDHHDASQIDTSYFVQEKGPTKFSDSLDVSGGFFQMRLPRNRLLCFWMWATIKLKDSVL